MCQSMSDQGTFFIKTENSYTDHYQMNTPCPKRLTHYDFTTIADEYSPRGRLDLTPIFELCMDYCPPTPPNSPVQKGYYGKKRLPKAQL